MSNEPIPIYCHSWFSTPEFSVNTGDGQSEKKWLNCDRRVIWIMRSGIDFGRGVRHHRDISDKSEGPHSLLQKYSAQKETIFADVMSEVTAAKREAIRSATEIKSQVGAGVWMWCTDRSRSNDARE